MLFESQLNESDGTRNFTGNEGFSTARRFVVEQNPIASKQIIRLAIVDCHPESINFSAAVGTSWIKRGFFRLGSFQHFAKHLARGRLIKTGLHAAFPNGI